VCVCIYEYISGGFKYVCMGMSGFKYAMRETDSKNKNSRFPCLPVSLFPSSPVSMIPLFFVYSHPYVFLNFVYFL
jgi:hypothetical protein